jgi:hypothetical protein
VRVVAGRQVVQGEFQIAQDKSELVIQIVRDSAGESAGQLKALHVLKLLAHENS